MPLASVISITQGALIKASTGLPGVSCRDLTLSRVMTATSLSPLGSPMPTSALTVPLCTLPTMPSNTLRALTFMIFPEMG